MQTAKAGWQRYQTIWLWLLLGWTVSAADRTITGPIVTWMIQNKVAFLQASANPHALGGLVGSLFFAGYMLTQFPGGYLGDKFGHRTVITISLIWAAVATIVSGLMTTLIGFILLRVITGLGEGVYYANDRVIVTETTPPEKRSLGLGVVVTGLAIGITLATLLVPYLINWGQQVIGQGYGWEMPFYVFGLATLVVSLIIYQTFKAEKRPARLPYGKAFREMATYSVVFLVAIMAVYFIADRMGLPNWLVAVIELLLAFLLVWFAYGKKGGELSPVLHNKDLVLIYCSAVAVLWNLWFFGFWSVAIIANAAHTSFLQAALTATFNGVAGILGFPAGGYVADLAKRKGWGRKRSLVWFTFIQAVLTIWFAIYILNGGQSAVVMGVLLFVASLFFNALQPISHALTADIAEPQHRGAAFGMWNLIGETGAVLSPAIGGVLRDMTGGWGAACLLDGCIIVASFILLLFVNELRAYSSGTERHGVGA